MLSNNQITIPVFKKETIVADYTGGRNIEELNRIVVICLEHQSAKTVFEWSVNNFISLKYDLVILIHVCQVNIPITPYIDSTDYIDEIAEEEKNESHKLLNLFAKQFYKLQVACKAISIMGDIKTEILRKVTDIKADVVVMGARQMGLIKRTVLGSVSDYVVHNCPCSVVITKEEIKLHNEERKTSILHILHQ